jgi:hypothetical protein
MGDENSFSQLLPFEEEVTGLVTSYKRMNLRGESNDLIFEILHDLK